MKYNSLIIFIIIFSLSLIFQSCGGEGEKGEESSGKVEKSAETSVATSEETEITLVSSEESSQESEGTTPCEAVKITTTKIPGAIVGQLYTFKFEAVGTTPFKWSLEGPLGMTINEDSGEVSWTPTQDQEGTHNINVQVNNDCGQDSKEFTIKVCNPVKITDTEYPTSVILGETYTYTFKEPQGTPPFTWTLEKGPSGMTINRDTGKIIWTPTKDQIGSHSVKIKCVNGCGEDILGFNILVMCGSCPEFSSIPVGVATEGEEYSYNAQVIGEEPFIWTLVTAPQGMELNPKTGVSVFLKWIPTPLQLGKNDVTLRVENNLGSATQSFSIDTKARPPKIISTPLTEAFIFEKYEYKVEIEGTPPFTPSITSTPQVPITIQDDEDIYNKYVIVNWIPQKEDEGKKVNVTITIEGPQKDQITQSYTIIVGHRAPKITSEPNVVAVVGEPYTYCPSAQGTPELIWSLINGPQGMSINSQNGCLKWTPSNEGKYSVTIKVTNSYGFYEQTYDITVYPKSPKIISSPVLTGVVGERYSYQAQAYGAPTLTWSLLESPLGMTIDKNSGLISWIPTSEQVGSNSVSLKVNNNFGSDTQFFSVTVYERKPKIISSPITEIVAGELYNYCPLAVGAPKIVWSFTIFPQVTGISFDKNSGCINWTPKIDQIGSYQITLTATNNEGSDTQTFTLQVLSGTPVKIISTPDTVARATILYTYQAKAEGYPQPKWYLITSPQGMGINSDTGLISWTPTLSQINEVPYNVTLKADNGVSYATQSYQIKVIHPDAPLITSKPITEAVVGIEYTYQVNVGGKTPFTWALLKGPSTMTISSDGLVKWLPSSTLPEVNDVSIKVSNSYGEDTQNYQIRVYPQMPTIISTPPQLACVEQLYKYQPEAKGAPTIIWFLDKKPSGMTINSSTGLIQWVPRADQGGNHQVIIRAQNNYGTAKQDYFITTESPKIVSTPLTAAVVGGMYRYQPQIGSKDTKVTWKVEGPKGMTIRSDGYITWVPTIDQVDPVTGVKVYDVVLTATSTNCGQYTQNFKIEVKSKWSVSPTVSTSSISTDCLTANGFSTAKLEIIPKDDRGAYLPAGLKVTVNSSAQGYNIKVIDNEDGTYTATIIAPKTPADTTLSIDVEAEGKITTLSNTYSIISKPAADREGGIGGCLANGEVTVTVIDALTKNPIEDAFIMIGQELNKPFEKNYTFSNDKGEAIIMNSALQGKYDITVVSEGYILFTLTSIKGSDLVIPLKRLEKNNPPIPTTYDVSGNLLNYTDPPGTSDIYMGFVIEQLNINQVMTFDLFELLAPFETVSIMGMTLSLPGNVAVPAQNLGIYPIPKIDYLLPIRPTNSTNISAVSGTLPLQGNPSITSCLNSAQGTTFDYDKFIRCLIVIIKPDKGGVISNLKVSSNISGKDINLTTPLEETMQLVVRNVPRGLTGLAVTFMHNDEGTQFLPTGFKDVNVPTGGEGKVKITTVDKTGPYANLKWGALVTYSTVSTTANTNVSIFKRNIPNRNTQNLTFNNFFNPINQENMTITGRTFSYTNPKNTIISPPSPDPTIAYSIFEEIKTVQDPDNPSSNIIIFNPRWEVYTPGDTFSFSLPRIPTSEQVNGYVPIPPLAGLPYNWRLIVSALGDCDSTDINDYSLDSYNACVTHASSNTNSFVLAR